MRRKSRKKKSFSKKLWKIGILVLIFFLILDLYLLFDSSFFKIKSLEVNLEKIGCVTKDKILSENSLIGQNFFLLSGDFEKKIKDKYFCIKDIHLEKKFPDKIKLNISGREAVVVLVSLKTSEASISGLLENLSTPSSYLVSQDNISQEVLVDSEGIIFSKYEGGTLPKIFLTASDLNIGKKIEEEVIKNSLNIIEKVKTFGLSLQEARIYSKNTLYLSPTTNLPKLIFALNKDINVQLASLQLILEEAKIDMQEMEFIDLRYDKPIVKYIPKKKN